MPKLAYGRLVVIAIAVAVGLVVGIFWGEEIRLSDRASEYIGLTFSILAASLFAVVSILGDPGMLMSGSWRAAWLNAKEIQGNLQRLNYLFVIYIVILGLLVVTEIIESARWNEYYFVHNIFAGLSAFAFVCSLALPFELSSIQRARLEAEIKERKQKNGNS